MRRNKVQSKRKKQKRKIQLTVKPKVRWNPKAKSFNSYPYLLIISCLRSNIFLNVTNYKGETKLWTNAGRAGFKGQTKTEYMAIVTITENFLIKAWSYGIRRVIVIFKNYSRSQRAVKRGFRNIRKSNRKIPRYQKRVLKLISYGFCSHLSFNGCKGKKKRRR